MKTKLLLFLIVMVVPFSLSFAGDEITVMTTIKKQKFVLDELHVKAGHPVRLKVINEDSIPVEFESSDLNIEVIVYPRKSHDFLLKGLKPGVYEFFNDFRPKEMHGKIVVE
jgi:plastocyanin